MDDETIEPLAMSSPPELAPQGPHPDSPVPRRPGAPTSSPEFRRAALHEAKLIAQRARFASGATYEDIGAACGRHLTHTYDALNVRNDVRSLSHSDLLAMSRDDRTRTFVVHLLAPIIANLGGNDG